MAKLFVVSGPSGVGKNTILNRIVAENDSVRYSVSATSRPIRGDEVDGVNYHFVTRERFEQMIAGGELLEYAEYCGNYYGTPLFAVQEAIRQGYDVVMDVEVVGARKIKELVPDAVFVFISVSDMNILRNRLILRGDVSPEDIEKRLERAKWECSQAAQLDDYVVLNDEIDTAVSELSSIIQAEKCKTVERIHLLKED